MLMRQLELNHNLHPISILIPNMPREWEAVLESLSEIKHGQIQSGTATEILHQKDLNPVPACVSQLVINMQLSD